MSLRPSILISLKMPGPVPPYTDLLLKFSSMLLFPPALTIPLHNLLTYHPPPFVNLRNQSCSQFHFPIIFALITNEKFPSSYSNTSWSYTFLLLPPPVPQLVTFSEQWCSSNSHPLYIPHSICLIVGKCAFGCNVNSGNLC